MITVLNYESEAKYLLEKKASTFQFKVHVPKVREVVIGRSNNVETSVNIENVKKDGIKVRKRQSGGEAVILSKETVVIGIVRNNTPLKNPNFYFSKFNKVIIEILKELGIENVCENGISDICIGNKKILGSSIYWHKSKLLYHAVLNVNEPLENMEKYLKHPKREPDYRKNRTHKKFVTSLKNEGYNLSPVYLSKYIQEKLNTALK